MNKPIALIGPQSPSLPGKAIRARRREMKRSLSRAALFETLLADKKGCEVGSGGITAEQSARAGQERCGLPVGIVGVT